jgi:hypothetical protein
MRVGGLAELGEHAEGGFRVEEGDEFVARALEGDLVDQAGALVLGLGELAGDVVGGEGDVVDAAGRVFFEELGDRAVVGGGFEQFDVDVSGGEKRGADLLGFDLLAAFAGAGRERFRSRGWIRRGI